MRKRSKLMLAMGAALAGIAALGATGTAAWYSIQAKATVTNTANISAPSNLIEIGIWNPFGYSHAATAEEQTPSSSKPMSDATVLTDVHSADGASFEKYDILDDGTVGSLGGSHQSSALTPVSYDVSDNPTFTAAASNTAYAADATTGGSASKVGVKNGARAFQRFGFFIHAINACTVSVTTDNFVVTHADAEDNAAMYAQVGEATGHSGDAGAATCTKAQLPISGKVLEGTPATTPVTADLGLADPGSMAADAYKYYVVTVWGEGSLFFANEGLDTATTAITIIFGAVAA